MKLFTLVLCLLSVSAFASTLDCRERTTNGDVQYLIRFDNDVAVVMQINGMPYQAIHKYDGNSNYVTVIAETEGDVFEISFENQRFSEDQFIAANVLSYYTDSRQIRCRYKN